MGQKNRAENDAAGGETGSHPASAEHGPRDRLAAELRRLRDLAGISGRDLADRVGISQSTLSRIETGRAMPSLPQVSAWSRAVGATAEADRNLRGLTEAAHSELTTWRSALASRTHIQDDFQAHESAATTVLNFQPTLVPGLLQTAEYARHIFGIFQVPYTAAGLAAAVAARLDRQPALYDPNRRFEFLIGETALRLRPGPRHILLAQLDRIASVDTLDTVSIGIIPADIEAKATIPHSFVIYEGEDPVVSVEMVDANRLVRAPDGIDMYRERWALLRGMALYGADAANFLTSIASEIRALEDR
ncbi:helix-turn-helix domain-containing protein [Nocardia bovistercoris]|uniref:Helix-turn-helix transcriptional regulator n=1 Tax=Nocardia bovistercoris TaxID=2785916 RepID=A0A931N7X0_9NOCA|nr:helix-turn-helix transcriptional regulator [Nocardia bovistercoris]MBH0781163.1 helix-turn-helix transcriptional regulator [Nocardia bovistercoris]